MKIPPYKEKFEPDEWLAVMSIVHPDAVEQTLGVLHLHSGLLSAAKFGLEMLRYCKARDVKIANVEQTESSLVFLISEGEKYVVNPENPVTPPNAA